MNEIELKSIIDKVSNEILDLDIITENGVIVNGNTKNNSDIVFYTSHEGYKNLMNEVFEKLKKEINEKQ